MLLIDVATASADVGATSARLAKIARIADLLARAAEQSDPKLVPVVVSWLSGELPQRQIGVGWADVAFAAGRGRRAVAHRDRRRLRLLRDPGGRR